MFVMTAPSRAARLLRPSSTSHPIARRRTRTHISPGGMAGCKPMLTAAITTSIVPTAAPRRSRARSAGATRRKFFELADIAGNVRKGSFEQTVWILDLTHDTTIAME